MNKAFTLTHEQTSLIEKTELDNLFEATSDYRQHLQEVYKKNDYKDLEASLQLPFDKTHLENVQNIAAQYSTPDLKYVIVIGIGGSNLGTMAIYEALYTKLDILTDRSPKILFLDTVSSKNLEIISSLLKNCTDGCEYVITAISKSGGTAETLSNTETLISHLEPENPDILKRTVLITDENSKLWNKAQELNINALPIPQMVGGRYSVFSAVGLFPLYLTGIDCEQLLLGAQNAITDGTSDESEINYSFLSAALSHIHNDDGKIIHNTFLFNPEMESCGKWYRQLMGESIGKEKDKDGNTIHAGITPIVSIGSTDLHSMAQLYFGGPRNKFTNIVYYQNEKPVTVPAKPTLNLVDGISNKTFTEIMNAIIGGVKAAYENNNLPYIIIELKTLDEYSIGYYLQFRMIEMMYLAHLMNVNAFDQPNVEDYKSVTRELLGN